MKFSDKVRKSIESGVYRIRRGEGACGIYHRVLNALCDHGGKIVAFEKPEGALARVIDSSGEEVGEGTDITWPPAALRAEIDAGMIPEPWAGKLKETLTKPEDIERVRGMFGYARIVRPAAIAMTKVWSDGGKVIVRRADLGVEIKFYDKNHNVTAESQGIFCPACATVIAAGRNPELSEYIRESLKDATNIGKVKYERKIENWIEWKEGRVRTTLKEAGKVLEEFWGCCTAYAIVRTEMKAGLMGSGVGRVLKAYCDLCPVKHCWFEKPMGAIGNIILDRMTKIDVAEEVKMEEYITAVIKDRGEVIGKGIGTLCALSATVNAFMKADAVKVLKPSPATRFIVPPKLGRGDRNA